MVRFRKRGTVDHTRQEAQTTDIDVKEIDIDPGKMYKRGGLLPEMWKTRNR